MSNSAIIPMREGSLRRGAITLTAANMLDFGLQLLLPVALVRLLPAAGFADYRLAWLAIAAAMAVAPFALPRSLFYFLPRTPPDQRPVYVRNTLLLLLASGACAGLLLGPWNGLLPASLRAIEGGAWFLPAFLAMWVAASVAEFLPSARGEIQVQARLTVVLAVVRVAMVGLAALAGRVDVVFGALLAYAALKLALVAAYAWRHFGPRPRSRPMSHHAPAALRTQLAYALPFGLASALFLLRGQADQWVAAAMFPAAAFAAFSIGAVILPVVALMRTSMAGAISARLSALEAASDRDAMLRLNQRANLAAAFILLPTLALTAVLAPHIIVLIYTPAYLAAADVMRINCLALLGVAVEVSTLTMVLNQGRFLLAADALLLPAGVAGAMLGATLWGLPGAALGNVLTLAAGNAVSFWRVARATGVPLRRLQQWGVLLRILACALGAALPALLLERSPLLPAPLSATLPAPVPVPVPAPLSEALLAAAVFILAYLLLLRILGLLPHARVLFGRRAASLCQPARE